jgi:hypothetical protein
VYVVTPLEKTVNAILAKTTTISAVTPSITNILANVSVTSIVASGEIQDLVFAPVVPITVIDGNTIVTPTLAYSPVLENISSSISMMPYTASAATVLQYELTGVEKAPTILYSSLDAEYVMDGYLDDGYVYKGQLYILDGYLLEGYIEL